MEDVNYLMGHGTEDAYLFTVHSSRRNLEVYPDPNEYVINFDNPFRNVVGLEVVQALLPRSQYVVDTHNQRLVLYVAETRFHIDIPVGEYTHETLRNALNVMLNPIGVTALFQDRGRNVFELRSDRVLKLDVLGSTMTRLLGFNTDAEYPDLEPDGPIGENVEQNLVDHAWNLYPDTPPWEDRVTGLPVNTFAPEHETHYASITGPFSLPPEPKAIAFSYRYSHNTYTPSSFRIPKWRTLCQTPIGYDVDIGLGDVRVRRYDSFRSTLAQKSILIPLEPSQSSDAFPDSNTLFFSFGRDTWMDMTRTYHLVPEAHDSIHAESWVQENDPIWKGGLVLAHYDEETYLDIRAIDSSDAPFTVSHVDPETELVDRQLYLVSNLHYRTTQGKVPVFRYGAHPQDENHAGHVEIQIDDGNLISERSVEESAEQTLNMSLVSSVHDTAAPNGFTEPQIEEGGQRYASTVSNEYTFSVYVSKDAWDEASVGIGSFHRSVWMGDAWSSRIRSVFSVTERPHLVRLEVSIYDPGRSLIDTVLRYNRALQDRGLGWSRRDEDFLTQKQEGMFAWMVECWILILRVHNGGSPLDSEVENLIREVVLQDILDLIQRQRDQETIPSNDWEEFQEKVTFLQNETAHFSDVPIWGHEVSRWYEISQGNKVGELDVPTLEFSLSNLVQAVGLYGTFESRTWLPLVDAWISIFESMQGSTLDDTLINLMKEVLPFGVGNLIEDLIAGNPISDARWSSLGVQVQTLLDETASIGTNIVWQTELELWRDIATQGNAQTTGYEVLLDSMFRLRDEANVPHPGQEGRGVPGGGALIIMGSNEQTVDRVIPFESPSIVSILSLPAPSLPFPQVVDTLTIDDTPCFGMTLSSPVDLRLERSWFVRGGTLTRSLPLFLSNTQIQPESVWTEPNAWLVDASSSVEPPFKAFNTTNLSPGDGWRSESRTSPARFPLSSEGNHSPLFYWRTPTETLVGQIHEILDQPSVVDEQNLLLELGVERKPQDTYTPYTSMGNQWDIGLGGQNGVVVRGDSRAPALFACRLRLPTRVDMLYNTVICAIGGQSNAMAIGFDADGNLFGRCGNGRSLDPSETSLIRLNPENISRFLGHNGWLSWFLIPSAFGIQISMYWNGTLLGRGPRTSSQITRWCDSESGGYLSLSREEPILPWSAQTPHWIRLHYFERPLTIQRYSIETINDVRDSEYTYPMEFSLQVSNDNVRWKTIDTRSFDQWTARTQRAFDVSDDGVYWYVRLWIKRASRPYVAIGQWSMDVLVASQETSDHYQVPTILFGTASLRRVGGLSEGTHPKIPRVRFTWDGQTYDGFLDRFQPISETGVSIESKVYVNQVQNPVGLISSGDTIQIRSNFVSPDVPLEIDIHAMVRRVIRGQGTHPETGRVTDAIEWFFREDESTDMFERYIENRLVERGEIRARRTVVTNRIERRVLYPRLENGHTYTLSLRLLPNGTLRYIVLDQDDESEFQSRYYTIDPVPVMGLFDEKNTGRMSGFEKATLTFPQQGFGVNDSETYATLQDVRWSYQTVRTDQYDTLFMPYEDYTIEQSAPDGTVQTLTVRVPDVPAQWEDAFPTRLYHTYTDNEPQTWSLSLDPQDANRYWLVGLFIEGQGLETLMTSSPSLHDLLHVETHDGTVLTLDTPILVDSKQAFVPIVRDGQTNGVGESQIVTTVSNATSNASRIWSVSVVAYDTFDKRTCYYEYETVRLPQQVQNSILCSENGEVHVLNGEDNRVSVLSSTESFSNPRRDLFRVLLPRSNANETVRMHRLELGDASHMKVAFQETFRYVEDTIYAFSHPTRQGGTVVRDLIPSVTDQLVSVEAFRWIHYFTLEDVSLDEMSLHAVTMFFPDDTIFDRSLPLTFTLRDENSQVLDEFSTFWDRNSDSKGRVVGKSYGNDQIGPFTQLSSLIIAYDKFRTSTDIRLKRGIRYSLLVSTLDVLVIGENENVTDLDRMFPLRIAYVPSRGTMKGFVATYRPDTREPEWIDGFSPLRIQMANVEHRIVSPGITTLSPDSFLKLSIPEIEQHVFVHRNYDQWTGGIATFFLSPGLEHREFNEHMHVGLIKRFFPIGRLDQMTIRFLTEDNRPYNFRGVNHVLRLVLRFLVPKWDPFAESLLAPHYDPSRYGSYQKSNGEETVLDESEPSTSLTNVRESLSTGAMVGTPLGESSELPQNSEEFIRTMKAYAKVVREAGTVLESLSTK